MRLQSSLKNLILEIASVDSITDAIKKRQVVVTVGMTILHTMMEMNQEVEVCVKSNLYVLVE